MLKKPAYSHRFIIARRHNWQCRVLWALPLYKYNTISVGHSCIKRKIEPDFASSVPNGSICNSPGTKNASSPIRRIFRSWRTRDQPALDRIAISSDDPYFPSRVQRLRKTSASFRHPRLTSGSTFHGLNATLGIDFSPFFNHFQIIDISSQSVRQHCLRVRYKRRKYRQGKHGGIAMPSADQLDAAISQRCRDAGGHSSIP